MVQVDLLVDDSDLAGELERSLGVAGVAVHEVRGESAALTGAEIHHIVQIIGDDVTKVVVSTLVLQMQTVLARYLKGKPEGLEIVVDGIRYRVRSEQDLDHVLDAIAIAYKRISSGKQA